MLNWSKISFGMSVANNGVYAFYLIGKRGNWHWTAHNLPQYDAAGRLSNDIKTVIGRGNAKTKLAAMAAAYEWSRK